MKKTTIQDKQHHREKSDQIIKAENETEEFRVKKVDPSFAQMLIKYRMDRKLKRQDLARQLCIKENDLAALETGKAVHDGNLIHKIKMKLKL